MWKRVYPDTYKSIMEYKKMKVFDLQYCNIPDVISKELFDRYCKGQNTYKRFHVHDYQYPADEYPEHTEILYSETNVPNYVVKRGVDPISDWFKDNGCGREEILILFWW